ncbi:MAG TPA: helix-turn-helix domain-containing protein, partial [Christiangramia sp.]|nr:helix-turn-helix domain-containing protein [Christiangramia sp.]
RWGGNIRQLRNIAEQISVLEQNRSISASELRHYLPDVGSNLPAVIANKKQEGDFSNEREILYKVLFDMKSDLNDLKKLTLKLMQEGDSKQVQDDNEGLIQKIYGNSGDDIDEADIDDDELNVLQIPQDNNSSSSRQQEEKDKYYFAEEIEEEETLSLQDKELELIKKSLERHSGKRKAAAEELGISERTLYRKIKQYNL